MIILLTNALSGYADFYYLGILQLVIAWFIHCLHFNDQKIKFGIITAQLFLVDAISLKISYSDPYAT